MKPADSTWWHYIRWGSGRRLSLLGEKLGWEWLAYNPLHFYNFFHEQGIRNSPGVTRAMLKVFPGMKSAIDVGSGTGMYAAGLRKLGVDAVACEYNRRGRRIAARHGVDCRPFDLSKNPPAELPASSFGLAYSFEVAEHLPPPLGERLVRYLCELSTQVLFSAAQPGQGGTGHINEQPKEYWVERFRACGFSLRADLTALFVAEVDKQGVPEKWFRNNSMIFGPNPAPGVAGEAVVTAPGSA